MRMLSLAVLGLAAQRVVGLVNKNLAFIGPYQNHKGYPEMPENYSLYHSSLLTFPSGVASGDPTSDSVILWGRVKPTINTSNIASHYEPNSNLPSDKNMPNMFACVIVRVARMKTKGFESTVFEQVIYTNDEVDWNVKVEAGPLPPGQKFRYEFDSCDLSQKGRKGFARTLPAENKDVNKKIKPAVLSNSDFRRSQLFTYYKAAFKNKAHFVLHLGNYINEGKKSEKLDPTRPTRPTTADANEVKTKNVQYKGGKDVTYRYKDSHVVYPEHECLTLEDYRRRYESFRTDKGLAQLHMEATWITTWDEHDVAEGTWKDGYGPDGPDPEAFAKRRQAAIRAYFEWMPVRQVSPEEHRIWRSFSIGRLADLMVLDTRLYGRDAIEVDHASMTEEQRQNRTILGPAQESWLNDQLERSHLRGGKWRIMAQPSLFSHLDRSPFSKDLFNADGWDGYAANRERILNKLAEDDIKNSIILSGQSRSSWAFDLVRENDTSYNRKTGEGAFGVEFSVPSVNMLPADSGITGEELLQENDALQYREEGGTGYVMLHITKESVKALYFRLGHKQWVSKFMERPLNIKKETRMATLEVREGDNCLTRDPKVGGKRIKAGIRRGKDGLVEVDGVKAPWESIGSA